MDKSSQLKSRIEGTCGMDDSLVVKHSEILGELKTEVTAVHRRIDNLDAFMQEMRKFTTSMVEMNGNVKVLTQEIKTITQTLVKHEESIEDIKDRMETKDGMARLYSNVEELEHTLEGVMNRLVDEENKEARAALEALNKIKWWIIGSIGTIMFVIFMMYLGLK